MVGTGAGTPAAATLEVPLINLGERAFEIVLARKLAAGEAQSTWFERHRSTPLTDLPSHWPAAYRELVERRIARIESDPNIRLIEQPEYKRRWNTEPWDEQFTQAARDWLLARLDGYFFEGERILNLTTDDTDKKTRSEAIREICGSFPAGLQPAVVSTHPLAAVVETDKAFLHLAEIYTGSPTFSVSKLVRELVEKESVPFLPFQRYKETGLRKCQDWEHVWDLQRAEDAVNSKSVISQGKRRQTFRPLIHRLLPQSPSPRRLLHPGPRQLEMDTGEAEAVAGRRRRTATLAQAMAQRIQPRLQLWNRRLLRRLPRRGGPEAGDDGGGVEPNPVGNSTEGVMRGAMENVLACQRWVMTWCSRRAP